MINDYGTHPLQGLVGAKSHVELLQKIKSLEEKLKQTELMLCEVLDKMPLSGGKIKFSEDLSDFEEANFGRWEAWSKFNSIASAEDRELIRKWIDKI